MNLLTIGSAFLCLIAHVLIATSIATNYWLRFRTVSGGTMVPLNPILNDTGITDRQVRYRGRNLGIWVACYTLEQDNKVSCGFIDRNCNAKICWIREHENDSSRNKLSCKRQSVTVLSGKCTAFQAVRGLAVAATFFSILATTFLFVSLCVMAGLFSAWGGAFAIIAAVSGLISFAVFLGAVVNAQKLAPNVAWASWSYILMIAGWVIVLIAAVLAHLSAFADVGGKGTSVEEDEYSA